MGTRIFLIEPLCKLLRTAGNHRLPPVTGALVICGRLKEGSEILFHDFNPRFLCLCLKTVSKTSEDRCIFLTWSCSLSLTQIFIKSYTNIRIDWLVLKFWAGTMKPAKTNRTTAIHETNETNKWKARNGQRCSRVLPRQQCYRTKMDKRRKIIRDEFTQRTLPGYHCGFQSFPGTV